jgi:hypothetical protein
MTGRKGTEKGTKAERSTAIPDNPSNSTMRTTPKSVGTTVCVCIVQQTGFHSPPYYKTTLRIDIPYLQ